MEGSGEGSSRRGFLRALMRDAARGATEATKVLGPPGLKPLLDAALPPQEPSDETLVAPAEPELAPVAPATREVGVDELLATAREHGLGARTDELRALAAPSARLTPGEPGASAWLGGEPALPEDVDWPHWGGGLLDLIAQVDLRAVSPSLGLPLAGHLLLFFDTLRAPSGRQPGAEEAARVLIIAPDEAEPPIGAEPMRLSGELMLPRVWATPVQALGLDQREHAAYERLREWLAREQGVVSESGPATEAAYHRLRGLPNDTTGQMPRVCELVSRGEDADDGALEAPGHQHAAERWVLLAQVSGTAAGRLFFWVPREELAGGDIAGVRVIPHPA